MGNHAVFILSVTSSGYATINIMIVLIIGLGLLVGSFVNAWVWRTHKQMTSSKNRLQSYSITKGRSMCPHCKHGLSASDLIPVFSWAFLRGKCRYCNVKISWQYPVVELVTATLFGLSYIYWPNQLGGVASVEFISWLVLLTALIALAVFDLLHMLLPNRMIIVAALPVAVWIAVDSLLVSRSIGPLMSAAYGLVAFGGLFYVLFRISDGKWIGGGDVKLGFVLGAWLASVLLSVLAIFVASLLGIIVFLILSIGKRLTLQSKIPFGPMLIVGALISFYFGNNLVNIYAQKILSI